MIKQGIALAGLVTSLAVCAPSQAQSVPYYGEIVPTIASYCPRGWLQANGQLLPIAQNDTLYSLYGTMYGGDGRTTFGLPDMRGRMATGQGQSPGLSAHQQGQMFGANSVPRTAATLPAHDHTFMASSAAGTSATPAGSTLGTYPAGTAVYGDPNTLGPNLNTGSVSTTGGSTPYAPRQPQIGVMYCVSNTGEYPSRP